MQNTTVECPYCHAELEAPASLNGSKVECPTCKRSFVMEIEQFQNTAPLTESTDGTERKIRISIGVSIAALLISVAVLILILLSSVFPFGMPRLKFSKDAATAVKNGLAFQVEIKSMGDYFWRKNGDKILKSLEIKEIKTNGSWAVVFYKLSHGATEVKDAVFLYKTEDGYWVSASRYTARKKCQSEWFKDMETRIERFTKDSGKFDELDEI